MPTAGMESATDVPASLERNETQSPGRGSRCSVGVSRSFTHADPDSSSEPQGAHSDATRPQAQRTQVYASFAKIYRKLLGLIPFKSTHLSLYDPLESVAERTIAVTGVIFAVAAGLPLPVIGYIFGKIINDFPLEHDALRQRLIQLLAVATAYFAATIVYTIAFGLTAENVSVKLRKKLLECLLYLDQAYLDTHDIDVNGLLTEKIDTIQAGCSEKVGIFIQAMSYFVAASVVGFVLDVKLAGILLASVVPAISLCFALLSPAVSRNNRAASEQSDRANGIVESALGAIKVVQAFDMMRELCRRHNEYLEQSTRLSVKSATLAAVQSGAVYFVAYAANALAFYIGSRKASSGNAGTTYAVVLLILDASFVIGQFAPFLEIFARAISAKSIIQDLIEARDDLGCSLSYRESGSKPHLHAQDIVFHSVEFRYPARPTVMTLNKLNLRLTAGTFTALVGTSGGGKSTMIALLLGIYDYSGLITIGSHDVKSVDTNYLRSRVAVVDQDAVLLSGTIFDNVCFGLIAEDLSESEKHERCKQALKEANVDFLDQLPQGLHTRLGNEVQLSGGQRQRLCLARALIKRPAVLILDEPTSALDAKSEMAVLESIKRAKSSGTTVIMIAHRLSTTLAADHVAVVNDGKVVEYGTPQQLSTDGTIFQSLLDAQNTKLNDMNQHQGVDDGLPTVRGRFESDATPGPTSSPGVDEGESTKDSYVVGLRSVTGLVGVIAKSDGWILLCGIIAATVCGGIILGQAIVFGNLIQLLNGGGDSTQSFYYSADFFCLMHFILALIAFASYSSSGTAFGVTSTHLTGRVQIRLLHKLLHLDIEWFAKSGRSTHRLMEAFTKDSNDLSALGGVALGAIFTILTSIVGGLILALCIAWRISVVLIAAVPIMLLAGFARLKILAALEAKHREAYSQTTSLAAQACKNRTTVTILGLERHLLDEYTMSLRQPYQQIQTFVLLANTLLSLCFAITYFVYALAYWWGSKQVRSGNYSVRDFFTVLSALLFSAQLAGQFFSLSPEIVRTKSAARGIFTLLNARSRILIPANEEVIAKDIPIASSLEKSTYSFRCIAKNHLHERPKLEFSHVTLQYPNTSRPCLSRASLAVARGQTVALVGPSGAGKSSALALLERFYDPSEGAVLFDGLDMRDMDLRTLRSRIGLVPQDPELFPGSIAYNVTLGAAPGTTASSNDVTNVCRQCGLHDFIMSLPEGYSTDCGFSSSCRLSGGQRQRLAIARALVRDPEVLLLDEPTSALDAHSEANMQAALAEAAKGRTTIMVAHRLASIRHADMIVVFDNGKIIAQGTHSELVQQGGLYASLAKAQGLA